MGMEMIQYATEDEMRDMWNSPMSQNVILLLNFLQLFKMQKLLLDCTLKHPGIEPGLPLRLLPISAKS